MKRISRKCRGCGSRLDRPGDLYWYDLIEVRRDVVVRDGVIYVDGASERFTEFTDSDEESLRCFECGGLALRITSEHDVRHE